MEDDDKILSQYTPCDCCEGDPAPTPSITRLTCGVLLAKGNFHTSVRADIPAEAEDMYWLKLIMVGNRSGTSSATVECSPGVWVNQETASETGSYRHQVYDPAADCAMAEECGGTGTYTDQARVNPCGTPADNSLGYDEARTYTMRAAEYLWDYTGTINGSAISGSNSGGTLTALGAYSYPDHTHDLDIGSSPVSVIDTFSRSGSGTDSSTDWVIDETADFGYSDPDDYRLEFDIPAATGLYQIRAAVYFTPAGGAESLVDDIAISWKSTMPPEIYSYPYPAIGIFRLGTVKIRRGQSGPFTEFEVNP